MIVIAMNAKGQFVLSKPVRESLKLRPMIRQLSDANTVYETDLRCAVVYEHENDFTKWP